ncbi:hypothetical protein Tco_1236348 [Tanacetum coccineum]
MSALRHSDNENKSVLMEPEVNPTKHGRMTKPYSSTPFIANCFIADLYKGGDTSFQQSRIHSHMLILNQSLSVQNEVFQGRLSDSFQDEGMYEHVGPEDTRSQDDIIKR